jgi:hypothetical protein
MSLEIPSALPGLIAAHVENWGRDRCESGLLLLGEPEATLADVVAWPGEKGIIRKRGKFAISGLALARIFDWATDREVVVRALIHSHGGRAFLSWVDLDYGFSVPGFISAIVPHYREPSSEVTDWSWWQFDGTEWADLDTPNVVSQPLSEVTFDEDGVT